VAYEPNSLGGGCPFQAGAKGFVSFPAPIADDKLRGKPDKFADHYTQATLFYESQTPIEKAHIAGGFRFELSKVTVPAVRERMVASLVNVSMQLARAVAEGLGMAVPAALPKVLARPPRAEITRSPALSLHALPGDGGISTRQVAILVATGVNGKPVGTIQAALRAAGGVPRILAMRIGPVNAADGVELVATGSFENSAPVLFDAVVLPDGDEGVARLSEDPQVLDFLRLQYRHGKTILALGTSRHMLDQIGIAALLSSGEPDPGIVLAIRRRIGPAITAFMLAIGRHRHPEREAIPEMRRRKPRAR
jgi:catalase